MGAGTACGSLVSAVMMTLHQNVAAFATILQQIAGLPDSYRVDVLEKDYYVVLLLEELAAFQAQGVKAYFKGGTALYKSIGRGNRFSEDIDITVRIGLTGGVWLRRATLRFRLQKTS